MVGGIVANVGSGLCQPTAKFVSATDYCVGPPARLSSVIVAANGGGGPPYTYSYSTGGGNYTNSSVPLFNLVGGSYTLRVTDSLGVNSPPVNFTVPTNNFLLDIGSPTPTFNVCGNFRRNYSGQVTQNLQEGEIRRCAYEGDVYVDFLPFPDDLSFQSNIVVRLQFKSRAGGPGYTNPNEYQDLRIEIYEAYVLNDGVRTNFMTSPTVDNYPMTPQIFGTGQLFGINAGDWERFNGRKRADNCNVGGPTLLRESPNWWKDCNILENFGSLEETDRVGYEWQQTITYKGSQITFNKNSKLAIKFRINHELRAPIYAPPILNKTGPDVILPSSYTPAGAALLDTPNNTPPIKYFFPDCRFDWEIAISNQITNSTGCFTTQIGSIGIDDPGVAQIILNTLATHAKGGAGITLSSSLGPAPTSLSVAAADKPQNNSCSPSVGPLWAL
jgi:hypothetical protein